MCLRNDPGIVHRAPQWPYRGPSGRGLTRQARPYSRQLLSPGKEDTAEDEGGPRGPREDEHEHDAARAAAPH